MPSNTIGADHAMGMIIGLDIGATYSKLSYTTTQSKKVVTCRFRDHQGVKTPYAPTTLWYNDQGLPISWGYEISEGHIELSLFKYSMLHDDEWLPEARAWSVMSDAVQARKRLGKRTDEVVGEYISCLWGACKPQIQDVYPQWFDTEDHIRGLVVTYPAGWPKQGFLKALQRSNLFSSLRDCMVIFLTEAEAALEGIMDDAAKGTLEQVELEHGDPFIIIDHGGLTADIIGGTIDTDNALVAFEPATPPSSTLCGAAFLSDNFARLVEDKVKTCFDEPANLGRDFGEKVLCMWVTDIMPSFSTPMAGPSMIPVPQAAIETMTPVARRTHWQWVKDRAIHVYSGEIASILDFGIDEVVGQIRNQIRLMRKQLNREPKYIFVTGGFGCNVYLQTRIQQIKGPEMIYPADFGGKRRTVVSRGAATYGRKLALGSPNLGTTVADSNFGGVANGKCVQLFRKGECLVDGLLKMVRLPWDIVESGSVAGDGAVRLCLCRITNAPEILRVIKWQPQQRVAPTDTIMLEMVVGNSGSIAEFAFWQNGVRQSGISFVSDEPVPA